MGVIALLSDFGTADGYAGVMHGVILRINPQAVVVDICHDIPPQDVHAAAFVLSTVYPYFPLDTIYVVVVDPGVGSERRALAVRTPRGTFVAPDNGVLSYIFARESIEEMVHLTNARYWLSPLSDTFHGRDLFAPVAAHLSLGVPLRELGHAIQDPVRLPIVEAAMQQDGTISGQVLYIDRFGNLITNIPRGLLSPNRSWRIHIADREVIGLAKAYASAPDGELLALIDSSGYLELAVRNGSAAAMLKVNRGAEVVVTPIVDKTDARKEEYR
ncbi:MAG: SAM-dependent chlorinase/fluorinase [Chloroflexi bacterium]|nr:SAM-dependent chlorinase/fluorinase [Chloroflexota bacterium]